MSSQALLRCDSVYRPAILTFLSSSSSSLIQARTAHAHILKTALSSETHLVTKLVSCYSNHHCFSDAEFLLDSTPQSGSLFSFSSLIYASSKLNQLSQVLTLFSRMLNRGITPDAHVIPTAVKACVGLSNIRAGKMIHGIAFVVGAAYNDFVQSSLLHMYLNFGELQNARKVLDEMPDPDALSLSALIAGYARKGYVIETKELFDEIINIGIEINTVTWNGMISGFNQSGHCLESVLMFHKMHILGYTADGTSISSVLSSLGDLSDLNMGIQIHALSFKIGLGSSVCVVSALIDMYGKCGQTSELSKVFELIEKPDIGSCNALVAGLSRNGLADEALTIFRQFNREMIDLNVVSWTTMISCCTQHGKDMEALDLFREMQQLAEVKPNSITIPCLLPACGNIAALMHGKSAHGFTLRKGISIDVYIGSALIDMYAKCGKIESSLSIFNQMSIRNIVCWNAMMNGYAMHGKAKEAMEIFVSMLTSNQKPDFITFTCILSACSQKGLTEEGQRYFDSMLEHGVEPRMEHYSCMVNLLGRGGKLDQAYDLIETMPFTPDPCVWGALLSSCRVHKNVSLGEIAAKRLFELEPTNPGNYVLLSNIYASKGKFDEVDRVRDMMKSMGIRKKPGCSWIEIKRKVYMLMAGDKWYPEMDLVKKKMEELGVEMKRLGYSPIVEFVLQDVEEQEKEDVLCGHSEKLAVIIGLFKTPKGCSLRVIKNLRICGDCHEFIKFVSKFEDREIFVRDTNRFHHFKDGVCSCGNYW